jgi:hypothetical protein
MKASEIIKADAINRKVDPNKALQTIGALVKAKYLLIANGTM